MKRYSPSNQAGSESRLYFLSKKHSIALLEALKFEPKRFLDFDFVSNKRIRSERIQLLRKAGLIKKTIVEGERGERDLIAYELTDKGKKVLQTLEEMSADLAKA